MKFIPALFIVLLAASCSTAPTQPATTLRPDVLYFTNDAAGQKSVHEVRALFEGRQETVLVDHALSAIAYPTPISQALPLYPFELRQRNLEGTVTVEFIVDENGHVTEAVPIAATNPGFNDQAVLCVRKWTFRSATRDGINVCSLMRVEIQFSLTKR
jgi:TonB family protein